MTFINKKHQYSVKLHENMFINMREFDSKVHFFNNRLIDHPILLDCTDTDVESFEWCSMMPMELLHWATESYLADVEP